MERRVGLVALVVRDYDEAIEYYTKKLKFTLIEDIDQGDKRWVVVRPSKAGASLLLAKASNEEQEKHIGNQTGGRVGFFFYTDDFEREYREMKEAGVEFVEEPRQEPYGSVAVFKDLYGNKWDLLSEDPTQG